MLDWFTTIPGLLITCGVILLIIALVLFILGNKKGKVTSNIAMNTGMANQPLGNDQVTTVEPTPVVVDTPAENSIIEESTVSEPTVIDQESTSEVADDSKAFDFSIPSVTPVEEIKVDEIKVEEPEVTIYGGNNPLENTQVITETSHEPYGGAAEEPVVDAIPASSIPTIDIPTMETVTEEKKEEL